MLDLAKAAWAGCNGYLGKPVPLSTLHSTVRRVLLRYLRPRLEAERKARGRLAAQGADPMTGLYRPPVAQEPVRLAPPFSPPQYPRPQSSPSQSSPPQSSPPQSPPHPDPRFAAPSASPQMPGTLESALAALQARSRCNDESLRGLNSLGTALASAPGRPPPADRSGSFSP
jgi:hypothetical protein